MTIPPKTTNDDLLEAIKRDPALRRKLAWEDHYWFFHIYFRRYLTYTTAPFQHEMLELTGDPEVKNLSLLAFRNSAKTTISTTSLPIWSIVGKLQRKFVVIASRTQAQAKQHLKNIRAELEGNYSLIKDFGPFFISDEEWGMTGLTVPKYGARIITASIEQSVRGLRHQQYRPDLLVLDDIEDTDTIKTQETRDKIWDWLNEEIMPMGTENTKLVLVGNLAHRDGIAARLEKASKEKGLQLVSKQYPIVDGKGNPTWPERFPTAEKLEEFRKGVPSDKAWSEEYLLNPPEKAAQLIFPDWIKTYGVAPTARHPKFRYYAIGVDLAISLNSSADYTAMVSAIVIGSGKDQQIFIQPNPINRRLSHLDSLDVAEGLARCYGSLTFVFVEDAGYQASFIENLLLRKIKTDPFKVAGRDKHARLASVSHLVQSGTVLFPAKGAEQLIAQLVGFGVERHDDLVDAFTVLLHKIITKKLPATPEVFLVG